MNDYELEDDGLAPRTDEELAVIYEVQSNPAFAHQIGEIAADPGFDRDRAILNTYRQKLSQENDESKRKLMERHPTIYGQRHKPLYMVPGGWSETPLTIERPFPSRMLRR
jgi:hypothetical protein|tara:strand:- start:1096 stop:1425 length:330 start_codon:yes stop_codon:yes gene_type:complete